MKNKSDGKKRHRSLNVFLQKNKHLALAHKLKSQLLNLSATLLAVFLTKISSFGCCLVCGMRGLQSHQLTRDKVVAERQHLQHHHCVSGATSPASGITFGMNLLVCFPGWSRPGLLSEKYSSTDLLLSPCFQGPHSAPCLVSGKELSFADPWGALPWGDVCQCHLFRILFSCCVCGT